MTDHTARWRDQRVAVTGATGFLGTAFLQRLLAEGADVIALGRKPVSGCRHTPLHLTETDLGMSDLIPEVDCLVHCAGEWRNPRLMDAVNHAGTRRFAEAAAGRVGHWVQVSTVSVYGHRPGGLIREDSAIQPDGTYGRSKLAGEEAVAGIAARAGMRLSVLRPGNLFGDGMQSASLSGLVQMVARGWYFPIGPAGAVANFVHVDDVVEGLTRVFGRAHGTPDTYIVSDDAPLDAVVAQIAAYFGRTPHTLRLPESPLRLLATLLGWLPHFPLTAGRLDALTNRTRYSSERLARETGYAPVTGLQAGLARFLQARFPGV